MNNAFYTYWRLGLSHIIDINAYDHILFIIALCTIYRLQDSKKLLMLITAFTLGHSLTLALVSLDIINPPSLLVELLIPMTILLTAVENLRFRQNSIPKSNIKYYALTALFGLVHGMGFASFFKNLFNSTAEILLPLLAFNVGVETGQILIVSMVMFYCFLFLNILQIKQSIWINALSIPIIIISLYLIVTRFLIIL